MLHCIAHNRRSSNLESAIYNLKFLTFLTALLLTSCASPTPTPPPPTLIPTDIPTVLPTASGGQPTANSQPTTAPAAPARAQYTMNVVLDYNAKSAAVDETIVYPNHTGQALTDLLLAVEPDLWQGCFTLGSLSIDDTAVTNYTLDGQKLDVPLPNVLQPQSVITLKLQYTLALPVLVQKHGVRPQIFGYSSLQMNLTDWYPFVVPNTGGKWVLHDPWYYGEHLVYDAADYVVNVRPADPAVKPIIASSGAESQNGNWTQYTLTAGRTFALSASTQ